MRPYGEVAHNAMLRAPVAVGGYSPNPEIIDRASLLPIGQYEDGSLTLAVPGMIKDTWDSFNRGLERQGAASRGEISREQASAASAPRRTGPSAFDFDLGDAVTTAMTPITGNLAGSLFGAIPDGALGVGASKPPTVGIRAYHGSPHDFDKFSLEKIGTGEGAQAYGHGLYFAENEGVARSYRDALGDYSDAVKWTGSTPPTPVQERLMRKMRGPDVTRGEAMDVTKLSRELAKERNQIRQMEWVSDEQRARMLADVEEQIAGLDGLSGNVSITPPGRMYEVSIKAEPEQFLDWDKPLAEQSEGVRTAAQSVIDQFGLTSRAASDLYASRPLGNLLSGPDYSNALREAGIPGIRYLDGGSRSAGEGSHNYVVFDENLIDILRKYGLLGTAGLGAGLLGGGGEANATGLLGSSAPDPDNDPMSILQRYGLLEPPAEDVPRPPVIGPGRPDPFDRYNDPFFEVPEIINNPFSDPPRPPLPRLRRPLPFRLGPPTG
ncbi:hypothetical protein [uncultured Hyphomicrobium sp.]|uniref:hypothetical protein n=1 Tax=uncultured Hyphomicrobium sp. TaxID=194373 RepID=UPI0025F74140|nr:hypothetical protein [uncultured Hyphomicrobium sp.]